MIVSVTFQGSGNLMCALDGSDKHVLSVWEWQTEKVIARTMVSQLEISLTLMFTNMLVTSPV